MIHTVQQGRMLCAPDTGGPQVLVMGILTSVLCICSGQTMSLPSAMPPTSSWEHQGGFVFIHMESSLYSLPCSPIEMEVADPIYYWGQDRPVLRLLSVTKEGHLLFQHFQAADSGNYSCTISYTKRRIPVSQTFHYSILGYHVPGGLDTVLLFHSKFCEDEWTKRFLHDLQDKLRQLEMEQHCKFQLNTTFCFPSLNSPSDEFIVQVHLEVSLFGPNWDEHCNPQDMEMVTDCYRKTVLHNLEQVQLALTGFFKEHKSFLITRPGIPSINFTNEFVGFLRTEQCSAGYGQTKQLQRCLDCCIACPPGMFSPPKSSKCSPCPVGTYSVTHGRAFCTPCKHGMTTRASGASSMEDCVKKGTTKQATSIVHKIPTLLLIVLPALLFLNGFFILSSCYLFYRDNHSQSPRASMTEESTMRMESTSHFFRSPKQSLQGPLEASDSRIDQEQRDAAPSPASSLNLSEVTDETAPVLAPEEGRNTF